MARFAAGDDVAGEPLFALLAPRIRAFFLRSFLDATLAEGLTATTLHRLRDVRSSYRPELAGLALKAWIFGIAGGVRRDELVRRYGLPPHVGDAELVQAEARITGEQPAVRTASPAVPSADAARAAIARLPESQRIIVHLYGYEGLTFEQIAEVLGSTTEAVRTRARIAYQTLQSDLQTYLRSSGAP
jgi:RNA polymerase sigma-70 factor (ECF subfamily)